ncbi:hypothetical protein D9613_000073 [Agrocybe pediades]|uniref:Uncharacterized protein n=1 Tax=Agrocybe pediades TaxID=84607 RepID=A0A8H4VRK4_9AGAR|nr:hypothetical protein D9613_000073 [Agrocybe pediades]
MFNHSIGNPSNFKPDHHPYARHRPAQDALPEEEEEYEYVEVEEDEDWDVEVEVEVPVVDGLMESPALVDQLSLYLKVPYFCKKKMKRRKKGKKIAIAITGRKPYCKRCWVLRHGLNIMDFDEFRATSPDARRWNKAYLENQFCESCMKDRRGIGPAANLPVIPPPPSTTTSYSVVYSPPMGEVDTTQKLISAYHGSVATYAGPSPGMPAYHNEIPGYSRGPAGQMPVPAYKSYDVPSWYGMSSAADLQAGYAQVEDGQANSVGSTIPQTPSAEYYGYSPTGVYGVPPVMIHTHPGRL